MLSFFVLDAQAARDPRLKASAVVNIPIASATELAPHSLFSRILFSMRWVLGFDGGGTKTSCILMDESGAIVSQSRSGPSNPLRVGVAATLAALRNAAQQATASAKIEFNQVHALCAGLAGTGQPDVAHKMRALLVAEFEPTAVQVCTDLQLALAATAPCTDNGPAIVLVAGTGSAAIGRDKTGQVMRVGGHGPVNSDEGSAYDVGRRAVLSLRLEHTSAGASDSLGQKILAELGVEDLTLLRERAHATPEEVFPRLFPVVAAAADFGDPVAQSILQGAAGDLTSLVAVLVERLSLKGETFLLAKSGGMLNRSTFFDAQLDERLRSAAPKAHIVPLPMTPAEGAARLALQLLPALEKAGN
ncbi:MAG: BadF/BadG/BcrA/BcrD ATPase family protein [Candidatus Acidiferrum sp.]